MKRIKLSGIKERERERCWEWTTSDMRGKRYSEEKIRRQGEGKIKEKWSRTQNRMRWEGRRGKETRESKYRQQQRRGNESKDRTKEKRPKSSVRISNTRPRWSLSHKSLLTGNGGIKVCSCESWERNFSAFICSSLSVKHVELYYAKRLEDIGVILWIVFRQITSCLSVSSRTPFQTL